MLPLAFAKDVTSDIRDSFARAVKLAPSPNDAFRIHISVKHTGEPDGVTGETNLALARIRIYPDAINGSNGEWVKYTVLAPAGGMSLLDHTCLHEWMHILDTRPTGYDEWLSGMTPPSYPARLGFLSTYAITGGERETWAEAGTEWFGTYGRTDNPVAKWYAAKANWVIGEPVVADPDWNFDSDWTDALAHSVLDPIDARKRRDMEVHYAS